MRGNSLVLPYVDWNSVRRWTPKVLEVDGKGNVPRTGNLNGRGHDFVL